MKYIKLLWFDIRNGIILSPALFVVPLAVAFIACFDLSHQISVLNEFNYMGTWVRESFADYMVYIYGGMDKYVPKSGSNFLFPVRWAIVFLMPAFLTLNYPFRDMQGVGQQILVRTGGRTAWWISKSIWNVFSVLLYHFCIFATALFFCIARGGNIIGEINKELQYRVFRFDRSSLLYDEQFWSLAIIFIPVLVSLSINLLQMTLSLFIKPIFSFLVVAFIMISSAYLTSPYLIGNYAMSMRYDIVIKDGVSMSSGVVISLVSIFAAVFIGVLRFHRYDVLDRD